LVLAADDEAFDRRSEQLKSLHSLWQTQGVLAMLRHALHLLDLPARCLAVSVGADGIAGAAGLSDAVDGERRLTNYLHLAELLQAASTQLDGEQALIRWLSTRLDGGPQGGDEQIVRLESDADLVKVVTVHKSKGLEYPLVFLPFACSFRGVDKARTSFVNLGQPGGERRLHLQLTAE
ncbi:exodeoxyribonuclease V subunit beta, partial [Roseateles sp. GG27B]